MLSYFPVATILAAIFLCNASSAFVIVKNPAPAVHKLSAEVKDSGELFTSDGWKSIQQDLDRVPIFCCANEKGQPLAYTVEIEDATYTVPFFYCDVEDAQAELELAKNSTGIGEEIGIIPFPLGKAFEMWAQDQAVIVPNKEAILQAGAPPGSNPIGQQVPLFACMDIMQANEVGGGVLPLFMVLEEANTALELALKMDGGDIDEFEIVSLSLQRAVQLLATVPETPAFRFMAPDKSLKYINDYLQ
jgi:hypothetical protein